jgi:hypothetical protein
MNGDGLPDIIVGGPGGTDVTVYVNQTQTTNHYCNLYPRMPEPNPFAVGAKIEFFHAGALGKAGAWPFLADQAHANGTPIHAGLGQERTFDVRATFPGKLDPAPGKPRKVPCFAGSSCNFGILGHGSESTRKTAENRPWQVSVTPAQPRPAGARRPSQRPALYPNPLPQPLPCGAPRVFSMKGNRDGSLR